MTGNDIELHRNGTIDTFAIAEDAWRLANRIAKTEFVPKGLQGSPEKVLAAILKGHELGFPPMYALAQIHVINGRPGTSAESQRALILGAGHDIGFTEMTATRVTCHGRRADNGTEQTVTWTMDDAKRARLADKDVWRAYPRNMLAARASADVAKFLFPDVTGGLYTLEELEDLPPDADPDLPPIVGEPKAVEAASATATRKATGATASPRKRAARKAAAPKPEAAPVATAQPPLPSELDDVVDDLPANPEFDVDPDAEEVDPNVIERATRIAMKANDLGVDRAAVIYAVTAGAKTSGKALTEVEAVAVLEALRLMRTGDKILDEVDGEPVLLDNEAAFPAADDDEVVDAEILDFPTGDTPDGSACQWTPDQWRTYLNGAGIKIIPFLKQAKTIAAQLGEPEPTSLADLQGDARLSLASLAHAWVEEQLEGRQ